MTASTATYPLQFPVPEAGDLSRLRTLLRTGWVMWGIPHPETVYEHILATRELAIALKDDLGLTDAELHDLLAIIEIHDWPEALVGDGVILGDEHNVEDLRRDKKAREMEAMEKICREREDGTVILALYRRYETGADVVAQLAKELDKMQAVFLAAAYEKEYTKVGLLREFVAYTRPLIKHAYLKTRLETIAVDQL